jgi:hypothetical protein
MRVSTEERCLYAQWVVGKYEGTVGEEEPRRSRRTKRLICESGVRYW